MMGQRCPDLNARERRAGGWTRGGPRPDDGPRPLRLSSRFGWVRVGQLLQLSLGTPRSRQRRQAGYGRRKAAITGLAAASPSGSTSVSNSPFADLSLPLPTHACSRVPLTVLARSQRLAEPGASLERLARPQPCLTVRAGETRSARAETPVREATGWLLMVHVQSCCNALATPPCPWHTSAEAGRASGPSDAPMTSCPQNESELDPTGERRPEPGPATASSSGRAHVSDNQTYRRRTGSGCPVQSLSAASGSLSRIAHPSLLFLTYHRSGLCAAESRSSEAGPRSKSEDLATTDSAARGQPSLVGD